MPTPPHDHVRALFFQQSGLPMAILDPTGRIIDWNAAAEQTLGFSRAEAVGQSALLVRQPEDARKLELLLKRTVREQRLADFQTTVTCRDGREIPVILVVSPIVEENGRVSAVGIVLRDQTRRIQLERRLAEHERMVALGRLAAGLSHHINNILTAVSARVELALARPSAAAARQALRLTAESIDRLTNLTRNLLLFSAVERRPPSTCRPDAVARQYLDHLRSELAGGHVALLATIAEAPHVRLDARDFQQLLQNLVHNALEAVEARGTVTVTLAADRGDALLTVADDGRGIPPHDLPNVFEPFWTTRESLAGGSGAALGLGLTVARNLAAAAGGTVDLLSPPPNAQPPAPRGTVAVVRLPSAPAATPPGPAEAGRAGRPEP